MTNVFSGNASRGFASASLSMKSAQSALSVYQYAKAKKDYDLLDRAVVHMTKSINAVKREAEISNGPHASPASPSNSHNHVTDPDDSVEISRKALSMQNARNTEPATAQRAAPLIYNASSKPQALSPDVNKLQLDMLG